MSESFDKKAFFLSIKLYFKSILGGPFVQTLPSALLNLGHGWQIVHFLS
jgi:hypothetical protein